MFVCFICHCTIVVVVILLLEKRKYVAYDYSDSLPSKTPSSEGRSLKETLGRDYIEYPRSNGPSFLSTAEQVAAAASMVREGEPRHERHLVAHLTPILEDRLLSVFGAGNHCVLVNSEEFTWLPQGFQLKKPYLAPDQFVAPHNLVEFCSPHDNAPQAGEYAQYGRFNDMSARRGIFAIFDAKVKVNDKALGEFVEYLTIVARNDGRGRVTIKGMLYDATEVILITAQLGLILTLTRCRWTDAGSLNTICDYFRRLG